MSRKLKKVVASTLAVAMMAGTVSYMPTIQYSIVQAAETGATVSIDKNLTAKAGETFTFQIKVSDNELGYAALISWLDIDTRYFEVVKYDCGDSTSPDWEDSDLFSDATVQKYQKDGADNTNLQTYIELHQQGGSKNFKGDTIFATVTLKVKDNTPTGTYDLNFDAIADGKLMQGRVGDDKKVIRCTPNYVSGSVKVQGNGTEPQVTDPPKTDPPKTDPPKTDAPVTQAPVSGEFGISVKNATGKAGGTISTSLNIDSNPGVAGFTVNLSYDKSALKFVKANAASGWTADISDDGQKLVVVADPYKDVTTTGSLITLEFEAASTAKGDYPVTITSVEASKTDAKAFAGKGTAGTITVENSGASTEISKDAIQFAFDDVTVEEGAETATLTLNIKNNTGLSAFQGEIQIPGLDGFTLNKITKKADFDGQWQAAESNTGIVYVSNSGHDATVKEGAFCKVVINLPKTAKAGVYKVNLINMTGSSYDEAADKQIRFESSKLYSGISNLTIGDGPVTTTEKPSGETTTVKVTVPDTTTAKVTDKIPEDAIAFTFDDVTVAEGAETATLTLNIKNNTGLSAFQGDIQIPGLDGFTLNKITKKADFDGQWQAAETNTGIVYVSNSGHDATVKEGAFCKVVINLPKNAKAGVYKVNLTNMTGSSYDEAADKQNRFESGKLYSGTSTLTIGDTPVTTTAKVTDPDTTTAKVTDPETTTAKVTETTTAKVTDKIPEDAIAFTFDDVTVAEGAETATLTLNIKNNTGLSAFQGDIQIPGLDGFTLNKITKKADFDGQWQAAETNTGIVYVSNSGHNATVKEGAFCKVVINLPKNAKAGVYKVNLNNMTGSSYDEATDTQVRFESKKLYSGTSTLTIGDTPVTTTAKVTDPDTTTAKVTDPETTTAKVTETTTAKVTDKIPEDAIAFTFDDVTVAEGAETATLTLNIKNNTGLSAFQGDIQIPGLDGFTLNKITKKADFDGQWQAAETNTGIVYVSNSGHNATVKEGAFCKVVINLPKDAKAGVYKVNLNNMTGSSYDEATDTQVRFESNKLYSGTSTLTIGDTPVTTTAKVTETTTAKVTDSTTKPVTTAPDITMVTTGQQPNNPAISEGSATYPNAEDGPTVYIDRNIKAKAGEEVTFQIKVTNNNTTGYTALIAWLDLQKEFFDVESLKWYAGDPTQEDWEDSDEYNYIEKQIYQKEDRPDLYTLVQLYKNGSNKNFKGDSIFATVKVKVKDTTPDGVYPLTLDYLADGKKMCAYVGADKNVVPLNPYYKSGSIVIGEIPTETTPVTTAATTTAKVTETTTAKVTETTTAKVTETTTAKVTDKIPEGAIAFTFDDVEVAEGAETATLTLNIKNNTGLSAFQGDIQIPGLDGFTLNKITKKADFDGQWQAAETNTGIVYVSNSGHNATVKEGAFCKVVINLPKGAKPGVYKVNLANMTGSSYDEATDTQVRFEANKLYSGTSTLTIKGDHTEPVTTPVTTAETTVTTVTKPVTTVETTVTTVTKPVTTVETTVTKVTDKPVTTVTTVTTPPVTTPPVVKPLKGDVNDDGVVNAKDLIALKKYLLLITTKDTVPNGDINKDGTINAVDMVHLVNMLLED